MARIPDDGRLPYCVEVNGPASDRITYHRTWRRAQRVHRDLVARLGGQHDPELPWLATAPSRIPTLPLVVTCRPVR